MERLQAALERAREKRGGTNAQSSRAAMRHIRRSDSGEAWDALRLLEVDPGHLKRMRIVSAETQSSYTPYDMLRTKMLHTMVANGWNRVAITSPSAGCGKTTTSVNLATSFGRQVDTRTILMEMDMRRPAMAKLFGISGSDNVAAILDERVSFADQAYRIGKNVALAVSHTPAREPAELFLRQRTAEVIDGIAAIYRPDVMMFDMPPFLANDDTIAFLGNVDCALIVAEAEVNTVKQVDVCEKEIADHTNVLGVVLNKCHFTDDSYNYGYGYG